MVIPGHPAAHDNAPPVGAVWPRSFGSHASAVSWAAIFAGAAAAAALSLILLLLGVGLGLSAVSPWSSEGLSAEAFGLSTILWITFTQLVAAGLGGYLAGRLRAQWLETPEDEVYFRDTAHGFIAWTVATLATATLLGASISGIIGAGTNAAAQVAQTGGAVAASAVTSAALDDPSDASAAVDYYVDQLFRGDAPQARPAPASDATGAADVWAATPAPRAQPPAAESARIVVHALAQGELSGADRTYLAQRVAQHTSLSQQEAEQRVSEVFADAQQALQTAQTKAREAADSARKASAYAALWMFIALLIGAFVASLCATWGGRQRDRF